MTRKSFTKTSKLSVSASQLLAENNLGKRKAKKLHKLLYSGKTIMVLIRLATRKTYRRTRVWWGKYKEDSFDTYGMGEEFWTHVFTDYRSLWHVELWDPKGWNADEHEFLWMALSHLTLPDPYSIPGVKEEACISFMRKYEK